MMKSATLPFWARTGLVLSICAGLLYAGDTWRRGIPSRACERAVTSDCLTDLGVQTALAQRSVPVYLPGVATLARMGRIDDAALIERRLQRRYGRSPDEADAAADRNLASHRITAALRQGGSLQSALAVTPSVDAGGIYIAALDLLGRSPYGPSSKPADPPDTRTKQIVAEMAAEMARLAATGPERARPGHLVDAAELLAALGQRAEALDILDQIAPDPDTPLTLPADLVRVIGAQAALDICRKAGGISPQMLLIAAATEPDATLSMTYLDQAFAAYAGRDRWPDFDGMARTAQDSAALGHADQALHLARTTAQTAASGPSIFPVFPHISAARALSAAGADITEVRAELDLAEATFPGNPDSIVGYGIVSGPIPWGTFGMEAQARRELAYLRARIGDLDGVLRLMDGIDEPLIAWTEVVGTDLPPAMWSALLDKAKPALSVEDDTYLRARLAAEISRSNAPSWQVDWAKSTGQDIVQSDLMRGERAIYIYVNVATVGAAYQDSKLRDAAFARLGASALATRRSGPLLFAGFELWQAEKDGL